MACAVVAAAAIVHTETERADTTAVPADSAPGYRVFIDAATGAIVSEPNGTEPVVLNKEMENALSTSSAGLQETASPVTGGGVMVQLDGRFQNAMMATVDEDGTLDAPCVSGLPRDDDTDATPTADPAQR